MMSRSGMLTFSYLNISKIFPTWDESLLSHFGYNNFCLGTESSDWEGDDKGGDGQVEWRDNGDGEDRVIVC